MQIMSRFSTGDRGHMSRQMDLLDRQLDIDVSPDIFAFIRDVRA